MPPPPPSSSAERKFSKHVESKKWAITLISLILSFLSVGLGLFTIYIVPGGAASIADIISTFCMFLGITVSTYITGESLIDAGRIWPVKGRRPPGGGRDNEPNCDPPPNGGEPH